MQTVQIYVRLLDEGTEVWCPVQAERQADGGYKIVSENPRPETDWWEFTTGDVVRCREMILGGDLGHPLPCLVAFESVIR